MRWSSRTQSATPVRRLAGSTGRLFYPPAELPRQRRQRGRGSVCLQKRCLLEWTWSTFPPSPIEFTYTSVSQPAPTVIRSSLRWRPVRPPVRATRRWLSPIRRSQSYALPRYALPRCTPPTLTATEKLTSRNSPGSLSAKTLQLPDWHHPHRPVPATVWYGGWLRGWAALGPSVGENRSRPPPDRTRCNHFSASLLATSGNEFNSDRGTRLEGRGLMSEETLAI